MQDGVCRLQDVTYLVLDEADRMLDLGFEPHIRAICSQIRADRLTAMFSATWPTAVQQLAAAYLSSPARVTVGSAELAASHSVTQRVEVLEGSAREARLLALLAKHHADRSSRIIIFVLYKKEAPRLEATLTRRGWRAAAIHGDISQAQRTAAVEGFKAGTTPLLIATDVAARGLDIPDVEVRVLLTCMYGREGERGGRNQCYTHYTYIYYTYTCWSACSTHGPLIAPFLCYSASPTPTPTPTYSFPAPINGLTPLRLLPPPLSSGGDQLLLPSDN